METSAQQVHNEFRQDLKNVTEDRVLKAEETLSKCFDDICVTVVYLSNHSGALGYDDFNESVEKPLRTNFILDTASTTPKSTRNAELFRDGLTLKLISEVAEVEKETELHGSSENENCEERDASLEELLSNENLEDEIVKNILRKVQEQKKEDHVRAIYY